MPGTAAGRHGDEQHERHAAYQDCLRHEIEAAQNDVDKAENVEQRGQGAEGLPRTEKITSPRVI